MADVNLEDLQKNTKVTVELAIAVLRELLKNSEIAQDVADRAFDIVEEYIAKTPNKIDDTIGLPACAIVRAILGVPDNDDKE